MNMTVYLLFANYLLFCNFKVYLFIVNHYYYEIKLIIYSLHIVSTSYFVFTRSQVSDYSRAPCSILPFFLKEQSGNVILSFTTTLLTKLGQLI